MTSVKPSDRVGAEGDLIYFMEQSPSREAKTHLPAQELPHLSWNTGPSLSCSLKPVTGLFHELDEYNSIPHIIFFETL
jgi:hypothetical protein